MTQASGSALRGRVQTPPIRLPVSDRASPPSYGRFAPDRPAMSRERADSRVWTQSDEAPLTLPSIHEWYNPHPKDWDRRHNERSQSFSRTSEHAHADFSRSASSQAAAGSTHGHGHGHGHAHRYSQDERRYPPPDRSPNSQAASNPRSPFGRSASPTSLGQSPAYSSSAEGSIAYASRRPSIHQPRHEAEYSTFMTARLPGTSHHDQPSSTQFTQRHPVDQYPMPSRLTPTSHDRPHNSSSRTSPSNTAAGPSTTTTKTPHQQPSPPDGDASRDPSLLQYVPGLLPAAAGHKNQKYQGVEIINGQKYHIYEGGMCLPFEVNGERVNEWWGLTKANIPRKRLATACDRCRQKKVRCEPGDGGCLNCRRANQACRVQGESLDD